MPIKTSTNLSNVPLHVEWKIEEKSESGEHVQDIPRLIGLILPTQNFLEEAVCTRLGLWK